MFEPERLQNKSALIIKWQRTLKVTEGHIEPHLSGFTGSQNPFSPQKEPRVRKEGAIEASTLARDDTLTLRATAEATRRQPCTAAPGVMTHWCSLLRLVQFKRYTVLLKNKVSVSFLPVDGCLRKKLESILVFLSSCSNQAWPPDFFLFFFYSLLIFFPAPQSPPSFGEKPTLPKTMEAEL